MSIAIYGLFAIAGLTVAVSMMRTKHFFAVLILTALQGITTLFAVKYVGSFLGVETSINSYTLTLSSIGGIPSVIFLLICGIIFK